MLFHLKPETECELTTFVGRVKKSGQDDVPAVTFRLKLGSVRNDLLDLFSPTIRQTAYMAIEGQEQLPGVEITTPILRSKDLKHWAPETRLEGWTVIIARGITDDSALQMGTVKIDDFKFDFFEGGHMDVDFRLSTADVDEAGAGMLWGRQKRKVFATIVAPELPEHKPDAIDASSSAKDLPPSAEDLFTAGADAQGSKDNGDEPRETQPGDPDHVNWPFPRSGQGATQEPPQDVVIETSRPGTRTARGRAKTKAALAAGLAAHEAGAVS